MSDKIELHEVLARYAGALDTQRWSELAAQFTEDAEWGAEGMGFAAGPDAIVKVIQDLERDIPPQIHIITNQVAEPDGERARIFAYVQVLRLPTEVWAVGRYDLAVVKRDGRWLIQRMTYVQFT